MEDSASATFLWQGKRKTGKRGIKNRTWMAEGCQSKSFAPVAILLEICSEEPSSLLPASWPWLRKLARAALAAQLMTEKTWSSRRANSPLVEVRNIWSCTLLPLQSSDGAQIHPFHAPVLEDALLLIKSVSTFLALTEQEPTTGTSCNSISNV